jgi:hypothetical protein
VRLDSAGDYLQSRIRPLPITEEKTGETEALRKEVLTLAGRALALAQPQSASEIVRPIAAIEDPLQVAYTLAAVLGMDLERAQALLEAPTGHRSSTTAPPVFIPRSAGARAAQPDCQPGAE